MKKLLLSNVFKFLFLMLLTNNIINAQVTPTFSAISPICAGGTLLPLPTTSNNGITGTWTPALNNLTTTTYFFTPTAGQNANSTSLTITVDSVPPPTFTITQPTCSNQTGTIEITSPLGVGYTYSIDGFSFQNSTTFSNLPSSTYNVLVKNSLGCFSNIVFAVVNPAPNTPTIASFSALTNFVCAGTKGTLNFTGTPNSTVVYTDGTSNFSVFLDAFGNATIQTPNNLTSTTTFSLVSITSDDAFACSSTSFTFADVLIQISNGPTITEPTPSLTSICSGDPATTLSVNATGLGLTYVWKKGSSIVANSNSSSIAVASAPANTGFYSCTITDICGESVTSNQASLIINDAPIMIVAALGGAFCSGTTINLAIATTGTGLTYKWKRNGVDLPTTNPTATTSELVIVNAQTTDSGDYTCEAKSGTCSVISSIATITVTAIDYTLNLIGSTITSNQANATYQWIDCVNGNATMVGQNSQSFMPTTNGQYAVYIQFNNCVSTSECITIDFLEVDHFKNTSSIQLFPNPSASILNIQTQEKIIDIKIIDITGRTTNVSNYVNNKVDVSNLSSGMYFVTIKTENGLFKEKFIKQ